MKIIRKINILKNAVKFVSEVSPLRMQLFSMKSDLYFFFKMS